MVAAEVGEAARTDPPATAARAATEPVSIVQPRGNDSLKREASRSPSPPLHSDALADSGSDADELAEEGSIAEQQQAADQAAALEASAAEQEPVTIAAVDSAAQPSPSANAAPPCPPARAASPELLPTDAAHEQQQQQPPQQQQPSDPQPPPTEPQQQQPQQHQQTVSQAKPQQPEATAAELQKPQPQPQTEPQQPTEAAEEKQSQPQQQPQQQAGHEEQPQSQQQQAPGSGSAAAQRRNSPYICQVDSCGRNLAKEKEYYRRYRVCKSHAGASDVLLGGERKRYCQQCSVFHPLADFDAEKRSCRQRLSWHNNKRRKRLAEDAETTAPPPLTPTAASRITRQSHAAQEEALNPAATKSATARRAAAAGGAADETATARRAGKPAVAANSLRNGSLSSLRSGGDEAPSVIMPPQWAAHGRRGGAVPRGSPAPAPAWLGGDIEACRLAAAVAAAGAPAALLPGQFAHPSLLVAARNFNCVEGAAVPHAAGGAGAFGGALLPQGAPGWGLPGAAGVGAGAAASDAAILQAQLQLAAQMQANEVAQAAAAQDPAAAQAAAMTHLRTLPQQQRMQDPRAAMSLINVVRAAFEKKQAAAAAEAAAGAHDYSSARSSAFQPYRPKAMRPTSGDLSGYTAKLGGAPATAGTSPPGGDGVADWKARLLQRFRTTGQGKGPGSGSP